MAQKKKIKPCVSIDWLQLHTKIDVITLFDEPETKDKKYQIKKKDIRHNVFGQHREILVQGASGWEVCAVFSYAPLSSILPDNSGHLKIINKFLYRHDLKDFVDELLNVLCLKFHSISRLDIAADFKSFYKRSVPVFIRQVFATKLLKLKCTGIHLTGRVTRSMPMHYIRFGSRTTPIHFYIYNKSKELREKVDKPHIKERWAECGLLTKDNKDIWRCEFVLLPSQFGVIDKESGEVITFKDTTTLLQENINDLFFTLFNQYCVFVENDGQVKKSRMKRVVLLKNTNYQKIFQKVSDKLQSNRMDKVKIKWLHQLNDAWRLHNKDPILLTDALHQFIDERDLQEWYKKIVSYLNQN